MSATEMRIHLSTSLTRLVRGEENLLLVDGALVESISTELEAELNLLPQKIVQSFAAPPAPTNETIGYASKLRVFPPLEFEFGLDVAHLNRLSREVLIWLLPLDVEVWEAYHCGVREIWIGGKGEDLQQKERDLLRKAIRDVWSLPVKGKVFKIGQDLHDVATFGPMASAIRHAGGVVNDTSNPDCDYFVTNDVKLREMAEKMGARRVIDGRTQQIMTGSREAYSL